MQTARVHRLLGMGFLLALLGLWVGHTIEYVRVWGGRGIGIELVGSVHAYMVPLAGGLAIASLTIGTRAWRIWVRLGVRLDAGRTRLAAALRGEVSGPAPPAARAPTPSLASGILVAWPALALVQIAFYVIQENVEAAVAGMPAPGLGAISGVHAAAPLVHAGVALVLLGIAAGALRLFRRRIAVVAAIERIVRVLLRALRGRRLTRPSSRCTEPPLRLLGRHLSRRPPPVLVTE